MSPGMTEATRAKEEDVKYRKKPVVVEPEQWTTPRSTLPDEPVPDPTPE